MKLKIVASIEARMSSTRLPGKVLMKTINGDSMLEFMLKRLKKSKYIHEIIIATTINKADDPIVDLCEGLKIKYYRGSESDVLIRVLNAHVLTESNVIVELTGDCPLIDVNLVDNIILKYLNNDFDYVIGMHSNMIIESFILMKKILRVQTGQLFEDLLKFYPLKNKVIKFNHELNTQLHRFLQ